MRKSYSSFVCIALAMLLSISLVLSGCASDTEATESSATESEQSDELVLAIYGEPDAGFDPTTGWGRYGSPLFQSTLLARDDELNIVTDLAEDYTVSDDGLTWTITLRDAKFSDGEPVTSEDVVYTYETASASGSVVDLTQMESVTAVDERTVEFKLKEPSSVFVYRLAELGIVPEHLHGPDYANEPVGSGPYMFVEWDKGQQLIVEANPEYYGTEPRFKRITFLFLAEDAALAAAKAGEVDIAAIPCSFAQEEVEGMKIVDVPSVDNRGVGFPMVPDTGETTEDGYSIGNDVTSDKAIRLAVNYAVDRQAMVDGILYGYGSPAFGPADGLPWGSTDISIEDADPEKASGILAEAGWKDADGDDVLEKGDLEAKFQLIYPAEDTIRQALSLTVADTMRPLGIEIEVVGKSWDEISTLMHANAVMWGWGSHDPTEINQMYNSKWIGVEWNNADWFTNATVDQHLNDAMSSVSEEEAIPNWQKAAWDGATGYSVKGDAVYAWLVNIDHVYLVRDDLDVGTQRIQPHGHGWPLTANILDWSWSDAE